MTEEISFQQDLRREERSCNINSKQCSSPIFEHLLQWKWNELVPEVESPSSPIFVVHFSSANNNSLKLKSSDGHSFG
jgi:hypothetical protein